MPVRQTLAALVVLFLTTIAQAGDNWPQWRGPTGDGRSDSKNLPTEWSLETGKNIVWKTPLPSWSGGTPVIWGDRIFVTSPNKAGEPAGGQESGAGKGGGGKGGFGGKGGGRPQRDPGGQTLMLLCLSKKDGSVLWQRNLDQGNKVYNKQNSSSPSPVTDGKLVWSMTGNGVLTAFDLDGKEIWKRNLQADYGNFGLNWGYGSSPLFYDGKVIVEVLHGNNTDDPSYLVAIDGATGKNVWRIERPTDAPRESPDAYTTPALLMVNGQAQVVVSGGDYVTGHDPASGRELWRAAGLNPMKAGNYRIVASPVVSGDLIFAPTRNTPLLALKTGGSGDITSSHTAWKFDGAKSAGPDVPTPVTDGTYFYMVADGGFITVLEAKSGKVVYGPQRLNVGATVSSSPLLADGKLYITGENGTTVVIAAGPEFKPLATNPLDGTFTLSSIAVSGSQLFLRTSTTLYCIGSPAN